MQDGAGTEVVLTVAASAGPVRAERQGCLTKKKEAGVKIHKAEFLLT
jgi:hypothetical protein